MKLTKNELNEKPDCFAQIARLLSPKSPTAFPQKPDWFPSKARRLRPNGPRGPTRSPVRFRGRANGLFGATRRDIHFAQAGADPTSVSTAAFVVELAE